MTRLVLPALAALAAAGLTSGPASASYVTCGPGRTDLSHLSQYGAFYWQADGSITYQDINSTLDKKSVDPRCARLLGGDVPLDPQPAEF